METQLTLVDHHPTTAAAGGPGMSGTAADGPTVNGSEPPRPDWRLDDASKARGRAGIALAREALAMARRGRPAVDTRPIDAPDLVARPRTTDAHRNADDPTISHSTAA